jgi:hypothetical protein
MNPVSSPITSTALTSFFNYLWNQGAASSLHWFVQMHLVGGAGSVISNTSLLQTSSFANRDHLFLFQLYASSPTYGQPYPGNGISFVTDMTSALTSKMPNTQFAAYVNYADSQLSSSQWESMYYGNGIYQQLVGIKKIYDPNKVFNFPLSIGTK